MQFSMPFDLQYYGVARFKLMQSGPKLFDRIYWSIVEGMDDVSRVKTATLCVRPRSQRYHNHPRSKANVRYD
jgi:hypothetical protein